MIFGSQYHSSEQAASLQAVLLLPTDSDSSGTIREILQQNHYEVSEASRFADARPSREWKDVTLILIDQRLISQEEDDLPRHVRQLAPQAFVVMITAPAALNQAVQAIQHGAFDYLLEPVDPDALRNTLRRISQLSDVQRSLDAEASARQRAEVQNRLLAEAVSQMGDCVIVTDCMLDHPGPKIVFVNDAVCHTTGYLREELIGRSPRILQGKRTDRALMKRLRQELSAGRSFRCQLVNYRKDGSTYDAELFITPMLDSEDRCTHFVSVHRDITERQQTEQALRASEQRLRAILNTATDAIVTINYQGIIVEANPATLRMFGYRDEELIGQNVRILMPEPYRGEHDGNIERYLETGKARIIGIGREVVGRRKDGSTFPVSLAISQIDHPPLFTGIVRDISALKELQKQVLEIAAEEDRRIGHELHDGVQQELTGLGLLAQTVSDMLSADVPWQPACEPQLAKIRQMTERVAQGLSDVGREVHQLSRGLVPVEIDAEGLRWALTELAATIQERYSIECRFTSRGDIDLTNNFAATHLFRIVQEAVNNAVKHGHASRIDISMTGNEKSIELEVLDNGSGISEQQLSSAGLGLRIMPYRAGLIGATVSISAGKAGGTLVRCLIDRGQIDHV